MKKISKILFILGCGVLFYGGCDREIPILSLGLDEQYYISRMQAYRFTPGYSGEAYRWILVLPDGRDSLLSEEQNYTFVQKEEGTYSIRFQILDSTNPYTHDFKVEVLHEVVEYSPYISRVLEYKPAPGQFVNEMPLYEEGDTEETIRQKVEENISGKNDVMITLGGYGGYVTFSFDHTVMNVRGERDFSILGNAFYSLVDVGQQGGSCEPGIVMVAFDWNQNGSPDEEEWYELAGSEYDKPETIKNYEITYFRPDPDKETFPDDTGQLTDIQYIQWDDNQGKSGYIEKNKFHKQDYFPKWITEDQLVFKGTRLKENAEDVSGTGSYWIQYAYGCGYVDNHPNDSTALISFDIDWAVNNAGETVVLPGVDFIRVYTGINQTCGWIGETSTEIIRAQDLHLLKNE
jgi:hypothetical protein